MVDIGQGIDALGNAASTLIAQAYQVKLAKQQHEERRQDVAYQRSRDAVEDQRHETETAQKASESERDFGLKQETERHRFLEAGGIPSHTETKAVSAGRAPVTPLQPNSPISRAMIDGMPLPGVQVTPEAGQAGSPIGGTVPVNTTVDASTPESYDPERGGRYQQAVDVAALRAQADATKQQHKMEFDAEQQAKRLAAQQKGREYMAAAGKSLAQFKANIATAKGAVGRAMTGSTLERAQQNAATGLLDQVGGSYNDAFDLLSSEAGKQFRDFGVAPRHLMYAHSQFSDKIAKEAGGMTKGLWAIPSDSAVGIARETRAKITDGKPSGATPSVAPSPTGDAAKPAAKLTAPKPAAKAGPPASAKPKDDYTDDELFDARVAGKTTDADIKAFIDKKRGAKKGGKS